MSPWILLVVAGLLEAVWSVALKLSEGMSRPIASITALLAMALSVWLLSLSARVLPIGTAYAVWVGIGATVTVVLGALLFSEPLTAARGFFLLLLVVSLVGLRLTDASAGR